ncbi:hypothetical protein G3A56_23360 [Rhizobium oryzihabitans]|jgi:hypothetical protein|uniref:Uncharacterized protein n=1 Tax=Rhizobium oryzihabitans TaxID=2267833 RepID=A0A7L5BQ36_9HYPH|nr:hypothetical protein [Rhizobium oryzihabitans]EGP54306.1 hypothetical protein Agau_P100011 [Agrobacterium tumefaciens F2]QCM07773.1 hypothetical protein CFBP6626_20985 [Agrobacterium tumefaciens]QIB40756.1 hypothetical protein G3A56_23360 [Rhizobium oryzihabitans]
MKLIVDYRTGVHNSDVEIANADPQVTLSWLKKLDGMQHTLLNVSRLDGSCLMVGGGPLWYVVTLDNNKQNLTLQNPDGLETEMIELCAGGQYGEYPKALCVNYEQASQAVSLFFEGKEFLMQWL